jgi:putative NADH-flavin reductase
MKVVTFGAAGGIGREVVPQALDAGHTVTAVVRRPTALPLQHERLSIVKGDVMDAANVWEAVRDQDAVISTVGTNSLEPTTVYSQGVANMLQAMQATGARRLLCISATGIDPGVPIQRLLAKPILWIILKNMYTDLVRMENLVSASELDWTIVRPPQLTDKPRTGVYRWSINKHLPGCWSLSRADTADYLVTHLSDAATYRGLVEIGY